MSVVLDAGALIALERRDKHVLALAEPLVAKPLGATVLTSDPDDITAIDPMLRVQTV